MPTAYDEKLVARLRALLAGEDAVTEKRMFGGVAFLVRGHMSVSASRGGGLLVRVDPADTVACLAEPHATRMAMGGRRLEGWIRVAPAGFQTKRQLAGWVRRSLEFVATLPAK